MTSGLLQPTHQVIIVPVNNSQNAGSFDSAVASGTHWSVLVCLRATSAFHSFDSLHPANESAARSLANKLAPVLGLDAAAKPSQVATPRQRNSYDCGAHACAVMHQLVGRVLRGERVADPVADVCARRTRAMVREAIGRAGGDASSASSVVSDGDPAAGGERV